MDECGREVRSVTVRVVQRFGVVTVWPADPDGAICLNYGETMLVPLTVEGGLVIRAVGP